jgi:hypothetical protein
VIGFPLSRACFSGLFLPLATLLHHDVFLEHLHHFGLSLGITLGHAARPGEVEPTGGRVGTDHYMADFPARPVQQLNGGMLSIGYIHQRVLD